jgi:predicted DNA-binding transcriptional regulator AlpA
MYPTITREQLANIYGVSQGFLGYLLREKKVPLPVQIGGEILWYADEVNQSLPKIKSFLERRKKIN